MLITSAADDMLTASGFQCKYVLILSESSLRQRQTIHVKCEVLFSLNKNNEPDTERFVHMGYIKREMLSQY